MERVTGEENEVVKFSHRAKLYRFDKEISQWKERGVGDIKILQHKETSRSRVLMRRDQIHKLCANHFIVQDMKLVPNSGSDRSWVWHAHDFSEEVTRSEQLAVKFKSVPIAEQFRDVFYECQKETCSEIPQNKDVDQSLQRKESKHKGATTDKGFQNYESRKEIDKSSASTGFLFGSSSISSLSFSDMAGNVLSPKSYESPSKGISFVCTDSPVFQASRKHDGGEDDDDTEEGADSGDLIHFEPIISLPEKVDVVTGEEEEEVVFQERCKLYRYDKETKQWKERGVGNMKLLRDVRRGRARVVMRREQVHKLCANHLITPQMDLKPSGSAAKAWTWQTLADVSEEGEGKVEELAVRFKTQAVAQEFKEKFEECRDALKSVAEIGQSEDTGKEEASLVRPSHSKLSNSN